MRTNAIQGADDWDNNFRQGLGYETRDGDKFTIFRPDGSSNGSVELK